MLQYVNIKINGLNIEKNYKKLKSAFILREKLFASYYFNDF